MKKLGKTHLMCMHERAIAGAAAASRKRAAAISSAVTTWLLGFEDEAIKELTDVGYGDKEAAPILRERSLKFLPPGQGPCEAAAVALGKGLTAEMQGVVYGLAAEVDNLQAYSPAAFRALLKAMNNKKKPPKRAKPVEVNRGRI